MRQCLLIRPLKGLSEGCLFSRRAAAGLFPFPALLPQRKHTGILMIFLIMMFFIPSDARAQEPGGREPETGSAVVS